MNHAYSVSVEFAETREGVYAAGLISREAGPAAGVGVAWMVLIV